MLCNKPFLCFFIFLLTLSVIGVNGNLIEHPKKAKRQFGADNGGIWFKNNPIRQWGQRQIAWPILNQQVQNSRYRQSL
jgi:hypothetical protein